MESTWKTNKKNTHPEENQMSKKKFTYHHSKTWQTKQFFERCRVSKTLQKHRNILISCQLDLPLKTTDPTAVVYL